MTTYSLQPLANPNIDHTGFLVISCIVGLIYTYIAVTYLFNRDSWDGFDKNFAVGAVIFLAGVLVGVGYLSYKEQPVPTNTPVIATMADTGVGRTTGKHAHNYPYVTYTLPDGSIVMYAAGQGLPWPQEAVLYKN